MPGDLDLRKHQFSVAGRVANTSSSAAVMMGFPATWIVLGSVPLACCGNKFAHGRAPIGAAGFREIDHKGDREPEPENNFSTTPRRSRDRVDGSEAEPASR